MMDRILDLPWAWAFLALWAGVMVRANTTYWIGRSIAAGTGRSRWSGMLDSPAYARAHRMAERWGVLAVPLSFATVGVQTFVQLSAGVTRMPLRLYLPAVCAGCALWAAIYSTVGLAVFAAWVGAGGGWVIAGAVVVGAGVIWWRSRRSRPTPAELATPTELAAPAAPSTESVPPVLSPRG